MAEKNDNGIDLNSFYSRNGSKPSSYRKKKGKRYKKRKRAMIAAISVVLTITVVLASLLFMPFLL